MQLFMIFKALYLYNFSLGNLTLNISVSTKQFKYVFVCLCQWEKIIRFKKALEAYAKVKITIYNVNTVLCTLSRSKNYIYISE